MLVKLWQLPAGVGPVGDAWFWGVPKGVQEYGGFCLRKLGKKTLCFPEAVWVKLQVLEMSSWEAHPACITWLSLSLRRAGKET